MPRRRRSSEDNEENFSNCSSIISSNGSSGSCGSSSDNNDSENLILPYNDNSSNAHNINNNNNNAINNNDNNKNKSGKPAGSKKAHKLQKPIQRSAANARERSRMRVLSKAFCKLKTTLPWVPPDTKLSKLDTLRLASSYIAHLRQILDAEGGEAADGGLRSGGTGRATYVHPLNLTWPFTFSGRAMNESKSPELSSRCQNKSEAVTQC